MKKIILLILILVTIGCTNKTIITKKDNFKIEYGTKIKISELVSIKNGNLVDASEFINTNDLGSQKISFKYLNNNQKEKIGYIKVNIVDETAPIIYHQKTYTVEKGKDIDLVSKILCGDNYDRQLICKVEGTYDTNKIGEYDLKFTSTDSSNNYTEKDFKLIVKEKTNSIYTPSFYQIEDLIKKHKTADTMIGIDVSSWQGVIDWQKVKDAGVEAAMIRIGYGADKNGEMVLDKYFASNLKGAKEAQIKVGIYFYSYAKSINDAVTQADWIIENLNKETLDLPISFDWESWTSFNKYNINFVDLNNIARAFMERITDAGYQAMNYGSATYLKGIWKLDDFPTWLAHYTSKTTYEKDYTIWQLTNTGKVDGINANVDLDVFYLK